MIKVLIKSEANDYISLIEVDRVTYYEPTNNAIPPEKLKYLTLGCDRYAFHKDTVSNYTRVLKTLSCIHSSQYRLDIIINIKEEILRVEATLLE